jgi:beta-glucosidase-like glycosyl hydrolase
MTDPAALVAPSAHWHDEYGYVLAEREILVAISLGCRGVLLHGGPLAETSAMLGRCRAVSPHPFFAAAELGGGVGERFPGATAIPPLSAFDASDLEAVRRAARLTAREARAAGINWAIAPSCVAPANAAPIARSRTFNGDDVVVSAACAEWLDACQAEGVVATPGPYPVMRATAADAALDAGVGAILLATSHATDAEAISYLRNDAGFDGVIVAPIGALADERGEDEEHLAIACLVAGCDLLLGADDTTDVVRALRHAQERGVFDAETVRASCHRIDARAEWASVTHAGREATLDDAMWARRMADAAVHVQRGRLHTLVQPVDVIIVDDDPPRVERAGTEFCEVLARLDVEVREVREPSGDSRGSVVIALIGDRRIALGFDTFSDGALARVRETCERAQRSARDAIAVHFTPPDFGSALRDAPTVVCGWSGTRAMEAAAARRLARGD